MLEHLLSTCLWLLSIKTFFLPFLNGSVEVLKVLGNMNVKLVTQCLLTEAQQKCWFLNSI